MSIVACEVGIDVAKGSFVTSIDKGKPFNLANAEEGVRELAKRLPPGSRVHLESSGGYERLLVKVLREEGFEVCCHNPLKAKRLAQALGKTAKTDAVDARSLSESGALLPLRKAKTVERQMLADLSRAIGTMKKTVAQFKKRLGRPGLDEGARLAYSSVIQTLTKQVQELEEQFKTRVKASSWAKAYEQIQSVPGLGPVTARICVSEFPEDVRGQTPARICTYAGLAPIDDSSGKREKARIGHGNSRLKAAFYVPGIGVIRHQAWAKDLYARLLAKGQSHEQAMVAVMRRLLVRAATVVIRGSSWEDEPPKP